MLIVMNKQVHFLVEICFMTFKKYCIYFVLLVNVKYVIDCRVRRVFNETIIYFEIFRVFHLKKKCIGIDIRDILNT